MGPGFRFYARPDAIPSMPTSLYLGGVSQQPVLLLIAWYESESTVDVPLLLCGTRSAVAAELQLATQLEEYRLE